MIDKPRLMLDTGEDEVDPTLNRKHVGKLIQLTHTRYDISLAVGICSWFMQRSQTSHLKGVKRIWRYLSGTRDHGILFVKGEKSTLTGHVDSDYAGDIEKW